MLTVAKLSVLRALSELAAMSLLPKVEVDTVVTFVTEVGAVDGDGAVEDPLPLVIVG